MNTYKIIRKRNFRGFFGERKIHSYHELNLRFNRKFVKRERKILQSILTVTTAADGDILKTVLCEDKQIAQVKGKGQSSAFSSQPCP